MSTVGIFAGRGDVLMAMALAMVVGAWIGWKVRGLAFRIKQKIGDKRELG